MARAAAALVLAVAVALLGAVAGCNADGAGSPGPEDLDIELPTGARVEVSAAGIDPDEVTVTTGELVEFTNAGDEEHRLVAEDFLFDTGDMLPGETFVFLFEEPGRYSYRDRHGDAAAVVEVTPASGR